MGLPSKERAWLEQTFGKCIAYQLELAENEAAPTVAIIDLMQWIKSVPDKENTMDKMIQYFVEQVRGIMQRKGSTIKTCIVLVDGVALPVKRLVAHAKRYSGVEVYPSAGAPYLDRDGSALRPDPWIRFAANQELLRRELYPRLFNAFMSCRFFTPWVGQNLILSGFPGRSHYETLYVERPWESFTNGDGQVWQIRYWDEQRELPIRERDERDDPDLYHRAYMVQNICPCAEYPQGGLVRAEWVEGKSSLSEADVRMFWFDHFFSTEHIIFYCNDGDVFSVGGMYARERVLSAPSFRMTGGDGDETQKRGTYHFRNRHTVCMPNKAQKGPKAAKGPLQYINLNVFYALVCEYPPFRAAGVANPMATLVFMLILAGSDFVPKFLFDMGMEKVVWKTLLDNLPMFTHLVQINDLAGQGSTRARPRSVIMDEKLFKTFVRYCYLSKVVNSADFKKGKVRKLSYDDLKNRTHQKESQKHLPDPNKIRLRCRQIEYNLLLWRNGPLGFEPDPFQTWFGLPYFPYARDPETGAPQLVDAVSPRDRCADEAYACNLYRVKVEGKQLYQEPVAQ